MRSPRLANSFRNVRGAEMRFWWWLPRWKNENQQVSRGGGMCRVSGPVAVPPRTDSVRYTTTKECIKRLCNARRSGVHHHHHGNGQLPVCSSGSNRANPGLLRAHTYSRVKHLSCYASRHPSLRRFSTSSPVRYNSKFWRLRLVWSCGELLLDFRFPE